MLPLLDLSTELMRHQVLSSAGAALMQLHKFADLQSETASRITNQLMVSIPRHANHSAQLQPVALLWGRLFMGS